MEQTHFASLQDVHFKKPKDRLTVIQTISHETPGGEPVGIWSGFSRILDTDEQVWERRYKINSTWTKLDCGWFEGKQCSQVLIRNETGNDLVVNPTPEQRLEIASKTIEVSFEGDASSLAGTNPHCLIPSGESFRAMPVNLDHVYVRCRNSEANIIVNIFPL